MMDRRDFLHPRQVAHTVGQVVGSLEGVGTPDVLDSADEIALLRLSRRAMATSFEIVVPFGTLNTLERGEAAFELLDALEDQLTVYRDHSEVSRLNREAAAGPVEVEEGLFGLFQQAQRITAETEGAFDITSGALIKAWGFFRGPRRVPSEVERQEALSRVGMRWVELDPERRTLRYLRPGLEINLGAIGKGYALDRLAELLGEEGGFRSFLLEGGSSSVYARGSKARDGRGWAVGIQHPWMKGWRLGQVWLRDRALGTSAATFQHLVFNGRTLGHILDPRNGWPAEGMASATVLAPTAAQADALATAFYILGIDKARAYCETHPEIGAVLLPHSPATQPVVLGLEADETDLVSRHP
jgi:FAD:protein FMN transferase